MKGLIGGKEIFYAFLVNIKNISMSKRVINEHLRTTGSLLVIIISQLNERQSNDHDDNDNDLDLEIIS